jgi:hypothetical protein
MPAASAKLTATSPEITCRFHASADMLSLYQDRPHGGNSFHPVFNTFDLAAFAWIYKGRSVYKL